MVKIHKSIEIVASSERDLNAMGPKSRLAIQAVLLRRYTRVDITLVNTLADLQALVARKPDLVFLGMKFVPSDPALGLADPNKIWLSQYLADAGIRYTGSGYRAVELELNKELAKRRLIRAGLKTARFTVIRKNDQSAVGGVGLRYPLFVKPTNRGGGKGVDEGSLVYNARQLRQKVQSLADELQSDSLVEEYLPGREFSVGILKRGNAAGYLAMPLELIAPTGETGARFLSSQVKSADTEHAVAVVEERLAADLKTLATSAFQALGAQDYGRIDVRLDALGVPHFLEANLVPCLVDGYGNFSKMCKQSLRLDHESMILHIVNLAFSRRATTAKTFPEAMPLAVLS